MSINRLVCFFVLAVFAAIAPASAIIVCHDYTYYRVFGIDPSPPGPDYNAPGGYQHVVTRERIDSLGCDRPTQRSVDNDPQCPVAMKMNYKGRGQSALYLRKALEPDYDGQTLQADEFLSPGALKPGDVVIIGDAHSGLVNANGNIDHFKQLPPRMDRSPFELYSSEYWSISQLTTDLAGPLCTEINGRVAYGGVMLDDMPSTFLSRGVQTVTAIEVWRRVNPQATPSASRATATATPVFTPSPTPEPTEIPAQDADMYGVFVMTNIAGGSIFVGLESELKSKYTYNFPGGGLPGPDGSGTHVAFELKSPRFATYQDALKHYCQKMETPPRDIPLTGGRKARIFGRDYWVDTAPNCP